MSDTVNGWRGSLASGRCSYDWSLNAANTRTRWAPSSRTRSSTSTAASTRPGNRFTIGSTTDGVTTDADGTLTVHIQHDRPGEQRAAHWLPAPRGAFNLTMRFYAPLSPVLDRNYALPPVHVSG